MKKLFFILMMILPIVVMSQFTTTNPDTVCLGSGSTYQVPSLGVGYTYTWSVISPGIITSGQGTNSITVDWSLATPGLISNGVSVFSTSPGGCISIPVNLNVFILDIIPTITSIGPFCVNDGCSPLVGTPSGGIFSGIGVVGNTFCPNVAGVGTHIITYTYSLYGCTFTITTSIIVSSQPILSPIEHN